MESEDETLKRSRKRTRSEDSYSSYSSSSLSSPRQKKRKKHSKKKKKKKRKKKKKKKKKSRSPSPSGKGKEEFGSRGILRDSDLTRGTKSVEFEFWCREVNGEEVSMLSLRDRSDRFKTFAEDYNTVTLPHEKYYDYNAWYTKKMMKKKRKNMNKTSTDKRTAKEEMEEHKRKEKLDAAYAELHKMSADKARAMREREILLRRMQVAYKSGDTAEVERLRSLLGLNSSTYG